MRELTLTEAFIRASSPEELDEALGAAHSRLYMMEADSSSTDEFLERLRAFPPGLRALAVSFELEVQFMFGGLAYFFANRLHKGYCDEVVAGMRELGADDIAQALDEARAIVDPHWVAIAQVLDGVELDAFEKWLQRSPIKSSLDPLNQRIADAFTRSGGVNGYWVAYARKHPDRFETR